jgi:hypothetical protein
MCLPEYVYGLILIEGLGDEARPSLTNSADNASGRKSKAIYIRRGKYSRPISAMPMILFQPGHEGFIPQMTTQIWRVK